MLINIVYFLTCLGRLTLEGEENLGGDLPPLAPLDCVPGHH